MSHRLGFTRRFRGGQSGTLSPMDLSAHSIPPIGLIAGSSVLDLRYCTLPDIYRGQAHQRHHSRFNVLASLGSGMTLVPIKLKSWTLSFNIRAGSRTRSTSIEGRLRLIANQLLQSATRRVKILQAKFSYLSRAIRLIILPSVAFRMSVIWKARSAGCLCDYN
jgi:hypothetical protein